MFGKSHIVNYIGGSLKIKCIRCKEINSIDGVPVFDIDSWRAGALIQKAMPYLDANKREMLISGVCPSCWKKLC